MSAKLPEQGQIVTVRQRRYVVTDITLGTLPIDPLRLTTVTPHHRIHLTSIEDDGLGEALDVIWEVEPATRIIEKAELPEPSGFDTPERLDAFMDAVRWSVASSADLKYLQSPFRSGIEIAKHQLSPLARAVQMPRVNLLIADDVGLGKTVEAGLVAQELIVRGRARTMLIVCPAGLQHHWRDQMRDKFGLDFQIINSEKMRQLRREQGIHVNPWSYFPRLITSLDFLKRDRPLRLFREQLPAEATYPRKLDLLIIDEAHNIAPSGRGNYAVDSMRTRAIRLLAPHFEHKLFLSATPHNGYEESFSALLELLDNQRFARGIRPKPAQLEAVMIRRLKSELKDPLGNPIFPTRRLKEIEVGYTEEEKEVHRWLRRYGQLRLAEAKEQTEQYATQFVLKLLKKRLFSSPAAFAKTLETHRATVMGKGKAGKKRAKPQPSILHRQFDQIEEDYADDDLYEEAMNSAEATASTLFRPLSPEENRLLDQMKAWADRAIHQRDSKTRALISWLRGIVMRDGVWTNERVILFTEYRETQKWLQEVLAAEKFTGQNRVQTIYGGMQDDEREKVKAAFQAHPDSSPVRILLATDAASEGIDLQNHCHRLVHIEIPWNPNRMEQRNGRIDRHGQTHDPLIFHFVGQGYKQNRSVESADELEDDLEFLFRAAEKVEKIRADLGKVGPVIAEQVEQAMLGKSRTLNTSHLERKGQTDTELLRLRRDLQAQIDEHYRQYWVTKEELNLTADNMRSVAAIALDVAGQPPLRPADEAHCFYLPELTGSWQRCLDGLVHPFTHELRPITFDHDLAKRRDDLVLAHLHHPLMQMATRLLRAEMWAPEQTRKLHRVTARTVPNHIIPDSEMWVIAHARLVVIGDDSHRLDEELLAAGGRIGLAERTIFSRLKVSEVEKGMANATDTPVSAAAHRAIQERWPTIARSLHQALERRMQERLENKQARLDERRDFEVKQIVTLLKELQAMIEAELADTLNPVQLELQLQGFSRSEREQLSSNVEALELRLQQLPAEMEREMAVIRQRYANPKPRLFPLSVTFLLPERMC